MYVCVCVCIYIYIYIYICIYILGVARYTNVMVRGSLFDTISVQQKKKKFYYARFLNLF